MADLEILFNELPKLVYNLKLNLGNSHEILKQVILINNIQEQLRIIQQAIAQESRYTNINKHAVSTLPRSGAFVSLSIPHLSQSHIDIHGKLELIPGKLGNLHPEISLNELQNKINSWIDWCEFLQGIATDILSDVPLVKQLNSDINYASLPITFQEINNSIKINLSRDNRKLLQQQIQHINYCQEELKQLQNRLDYVIETIRSSENLLTILLGISSFYGKSGFTLEWLDDEQQLIISSDNKVKDLLEIINDCKNLQKNLKTLIIQSNALKNQAEQALANIPNSKPKAPRLNKKAGILSKVTGKKVVFSSLAITSSLMVVGFGSWLLKEQIPQINLNENQEDSAIAKYKSALNLGMEASVIVQNPPHPTIVWQQALTKWQEAIELLENIPNGTSVSERAKNRLARYRLNKNVINQRLVTEKQALEQLQTAHKLAVEAAFFIENSPQSVTVRQQAKDKWQAAISLLESIPKSTSSSKQAQEMLISYRTNYAAIGTLIKY